MSTARVRVLAPASGNRARLAEAIVSRCPGARVGTAGDPDATLQLHLEPECFEARMSELEVGFFGSGALAERALAAAQQLDACFAEGAAQAARLRSAAVRCVWPLPEPVASNEIALTRMAGCLREALSAGSIPASHESIARLRVRFSSDASETVHRGGPSVRMAQTAEGLRRLGHQVWLDGDATTDIVHVFNSWPPESGLARVEAAKASGAAVVLSPIYMDHREMLWARRAARRPFWSVGRRHSVRRAARRAMRVPRARRVRLNREVTRYRAILPQMLGLADHVILLSHSELEGLRALGCEPPSRTFVWNAIDGAPFASQARDAAGADLPAENSALCVGRLEFRKNQAMLVEALRGCDLGVVLVGGCLDGRYRQLIAAHAGPNVRVLDHLPAGSAELARVFAAARVFVLPSFAEGAPIAALEAAAAGVPLVLSDRSGEREYFGRLAQYCDPLDPASIRDAVEAAIGEDAPALRARRRALVARKLTVDAAARETSRAYERAVAARTT